MAAKSFKQMIKDGDLKRADAMKARLEDLHEEPGFNLRAEGEDLEQSIADLADYLHQGGIVPALEVRPREEGCMWVVDGHRRRRAYLKLDAEGRLPRDPNGEFWVPIVAFGGNDAERVLRVITSQEGRKLSPLELAHGYKRLIAFGWTVEQIAQKMGRTRQHVDQVLVVGNANTDVQQLISSGAVAATTAARIVRKHGEKAGQVLGQQLAKVIAAGGTKVTPRAVAEPTVPRAILDDLLKVTTDIVDAFPTALRAGLAEGPESITLTTRSAWVERLMDLVAQAKESLQG
ncbi:ParB/RepB/Spo0J family partition protein [Pseudomonas aeruginosa]|uniref:ParB/RepB/Spo0J family partition protein n=1 Tax=Pseudomonas aeruginosa TaxID=287 RepID=UPI0018C85AA5|nr:ParB N-terminal domain-containing protein [Pseudomonas aeruginosa]MBG4569930.1 ParB N-terminal domain-containing protein [Pseudomonas aeruginosa]MDM1418090.1 ParB N-terminal domain-containing protein [Pseudomonas aeruginosa]MDM1433207.1 ParB N-terminal domain-containing protein [Pseudomonas aeruginosa]MDM1441093.1 ParB N-terminal domain-containing protein [Pseudomonas aeruginosa]